MYAPVKIFLLPSVVTDNESLFGITTTIAPVMGCGEY